MKKMKSMLIAAVMAQALMGCSQGVKADFQMENAVATTPVKSAASVKNNFNDVSDHWSESHVRAAMLAGFVDGYPDGTFRPEAPVSRAEFIKMLSAALKQEVSLRYGPWYEPYLKAAVQGGIHRYKDFSQDINGAISRQEMIRLIVRSANPELQKEDADMEDPSFVYSAAKKGLIQGLAGSSLGLAESTTRAQAVTVIERVLKLNDGGVLPVDPLAVQLADIGLTGTNFMSVLGRPTALKLPVEHEMAGVKLKINEVYAVDTTDKSGPFWGLVEGGKRYDEKSLENNYIFVFKVTWDLGQGSGQAEPIRIADFFRVGGGWQNIYKAGTTYGIIRPHETGPVESYWMYGMDKSRFANGETPSPGYYVNGQSFQMFLKIKK